MEGEDYPSLIFNERWRRLIRRVAYLKVVDIKKKKIIPKNAFSNFGDTVQE